MLSIENDRTIKVNRVQKKPKKVSKKRDRGFSFTSFTQLSFDWYESLFKTEDIRYMVVGLETCPTTKRQHIQGYVYFSSARMLTGVKKLLYDNTYIAVAKGSIEQNYVYCTKEGNFKEFGTKETQQGRRSDLKQLFEKYSSLNDFMMNEPDVYARYRSGVEGYYKMKGTDYVIDDYKPVVIWLYGETGTGKTRSIKDYLKSKIAEGYRVWRRPLGATAWFDGYSNQDIVFLDEVRGSTYKFDDLLQVLDYDCPQVPVKGSFVSFRPKIILVSSNVHPRKIYEHINDENKQQLVRRCDKVLKVDKYIPDLLTTLES